MNVRAYFPILIVTDGSTYFCTTLTNSPMPCLTKKIKKAWNFVNSRVFFLFSSVVFIVSNFFYFLGKRYDSSNRHNLLTTQFTIIRPPQLKKLKWSWDKQCFCYFMSETFCDGYSIMCFGIPFFLNLFFF